MSKTHNNQNKFNDDIEKLQSIEHRAKEVKAKLRLLNLKHDSAISKLRKQSPEEWKRYCADNGLANDYTFKDVLQ